MGVEVVAMGCLIKDIEVFGDKETPRGVRIQGLKLERGGIGGLTRGNAIGRLDLCGGDRAGLRLGLFGVCLLPVLDTHLTQLLLGKEGKRVNNKQWKDLHQDPNEHDRLHGGNSLKIDHHQLIPLNLQKKTIE